MNKLTEQQTRIIELAHDIECHLERASMAHVYGNAADEFRNTYVNKAANASIEAFRIACQSTTA